MPQVSVSVGGRRYLIACGDGEEDHLLRLAVTVDDKIRDMRAAFGEIGDGRMTLMAALTLADELAETRGRLAAAELALTAAASERSETAEHHDRIGQAVAAALDEVAAAVEDATNRLIGGGLG